ncbi:hypothetical protein HMPREF1092_00887 [Clostridium thermobutyricum]|uniref:Uncharacterized protein n=1 Tax=Clostridium thermobutyricum TaxID=29372 RepID=N9XPM5_9CLOT|nr:hypothetical protein [Clostridium thermobutyricum]ENZ01653.1 hypothetical protein HMPREF1092_00887 [Clostridium thermobutyricum]
MNNLSYKNKIEKLINRMEKNLKDDDYKYILVQKKLEIPVHIGKKHSTSNKPFDKISI